MPSVHVTRQVALGDGRSYDSGETVDMTPQQAQDAVAGGWGELVREQRPETPEGSRARRQPGPERRRRSRGGYAPSEDGEAMAPPADIPTGALRDVP